VTAPTSRGADLALTATAPLIWGTTYLVATEFLPGEHPLTVALLRALPAGCLLLLLVRQWPSGIWWLRVLILGALNFALFWWLLFVSAYRLPGGVAGIGGVALLVPTPQAALDGPGIAAGLGGAASMACGTVLARLWQPPVPPLTFTAWQLAAGGLLLLPFTLLLDPIPPEPTARNLFGFLYLGLVGGALTYLVWFRGLSRLTPSTVAPLVLLSPVCAVALGWLVLAQDLSPAQLAGFVIVVGSIWLSQRA
jgi:probable blue pigment (indigoidine) exporter